jgi:hypothetical protein
MKHLSLKKKLFNKLLIAVWLIAVFSGISFLFWQNEWKYSLPTPIPENYHTVRRGDIINIGYPPGLKEHMPLFLHFFNPACPCSKFNIEHFKSLLKKYDGKLNFAVVVISSDTTYTAKDIQDKFGLSIPVLFDQSIAVSCGVYSTPQAAIINVDHKLYYRGNYNSSRYCTDKNSEYARMAIDSLLNNNSSLVFAETAGKSYGCSLPGCKKPVK